MPHVLIFAVFCLALLVPSKGQIAGAPILLTQANSTRGLVVESVTLVTEPFAPTANPAFSADSRTRVMLFANNLSLLPGETAANVTAAAEDGKQLFPSDNAWNEDISTAPVDPNSDNLIAGMASRRVFIRTSVRSGTARLNGRS